MGSFPVNIAKKCDISGHEEVLLIDKCQTYRYLYSTVGRGEGPLRSMFCDPRVLDHSRPLQEGN